MRLRRRDDRGSMPMAVLLTIIGISLSGLLATTINAQITTARSISQRTASMDVAAAGLEIALGHIRFARKADGSGDYAKLPCGPYASTISGATAQSYVVKIYYLLAAPPGGDFAALDPSKIIDCTGTVLPVGSKPLFVHLSSTGRVLAGSTSTAPARRSPISASRRPARRRAPAMRPPCRSATRAARRSGSPTTPAST